jgi:type I restriction-modification system DNA methylase subunit
MNTNALKIFAKEARDILIPAVSQRLLYWGFNEKGKSSEELMVVEGGYVFRNTPANDVTVPEKFQRLQDKIQDGQSYKDIREEAAYTWFNRLMAIKILEKNGYEKPILTFSEGTNTPQILQDARRNAYIIDNETTQKLLQEHLLNNEDEAAFALLLTDYCNQQPLLKTVFGSINDYTELLVPSNALASKGIIQYLNNTTAIGDEEYKEVELIGWLYQFYISDRKDEVFANFKKNKKARAEDIPAATQIFTPKWIVQYMVENTIGKLYLEIEPDADDFRESLAYFVQTEAVLKTASVCTLEDLRILDPACGSGHILVVAFEVLMKAYDEEGYSPRQAAEKILYQHLYGLDIDDRAAQLANFAVRLKAAQYDKNLLQPKNDGINEVHIYAFPEATTFAATDVAFLLGEDRKDQTFAVENALTVLAQGKNLGSAIRFTDFEAEDAAFFKSQLQRLTEQAQRNELSFSETQQFYKLRPYLQVLTILIDRFPAVVANPPYMGSKSMNADLKTYLEKNYPISKLDLMTVFGEVLQNITSEGGSFGFITPPSWMFLSSYQKFRELLLKNNALDSLLHLSRGVFGADFGSVCSVFIRGENKDVKGQYFRLVERTFQEFNQADLEKLFKQTLENPNFKYDFSTYSKQNETIDYSENGKQIFYPNIAQNNFAKIPGSPIAYWVSEKVYEVYSHNEFVGDYGFSDGKNVTGENSKYLRFLWEVNKEKVGINEKWRLMAKGGEFRKWFGNIAHVMNWSDEARLHYKSSKAGRLIPEYLWNLVGITWSKISSKKPSFRLLPSYATFDEVNLSIKNEGSFNYLISFLNSKISSELLKISNPTFSFQTKDIIELPFPYEKIKSDVSIKTIDTNVQISKTDWDSRETSWDFEESPLVAVGGLSLSDSYRDWAAAVTDAFYQLHENEEELNRIFIDIYGLQDELTPEVPLKDITILQEELNKKALEKITVGDALPIDTSEVVQQLISYAIGCYMGRYRLDKTGLHIAHPNASAAEIAPYDLDRGGFRNRLGLSPQVTFEIDADGIMPIMGSACAFADDAATLVKSFVEKVWGENSLTQNINFINDALGETLETYLTNPLKFWKHHTRMYKKRPIYWLFASSQKGKPAFQVLTYLHRMDKYTVQKIRTNYLHPHQAYLSEQLELLERDNNDPKTVDVLLQQIAECRSYDETLKSLDNQQIDMDLDDGVLENYGLFGVGVRKV